jgi:SAM-dependent methyltransferase
MKTKSEETKAAGGAPRDFNKEAVTEGERLYSYDFDDLVRRFALRQFEPFLRPGAALELGCHEGGMSRLLVDRFPDLTVIDAAAIALAQARRVLPERVQFVLGTFEEVTLPRRYDSIFLINVLEHVDDSVAILKRAQDWLTDAGRLFLVVPNANAPSRQIAVRMGLIDHNQAVTAVEARNGHRRTYALDTLGQDLAPQACGSKTLAASFSRAWLITRWIKRLLPALLAWSISTAASSWERHTPICVRASLPYARAEIEERHQGQYIRPDRCRW